MVIRTERQLSVEVIPFVAARLKFPGLLHCIGMAIIVLLIDFCGSGHPQEKDITETLEAFSILENAKEKSPLAGKLLETFKTALRRHSASGSAIQGNITTPFTVQDPETSPGLACGSPAPTSMIYPAGGNIDDFLIDPTFPALDDLWQVFDDNVDPGTVDWNNFFAEWDTAFLSM